MNNAIALPSNVLIMKWGLVTCPTIGDLSACVKTIHGKGNVHTSCRIPPAQLDAPDAGQLTQAVALVQQ